MISATLEGVRRLWSRRARPAARLLRVAGARGLNLLAPPSCPLTAAPLDEAGRLGADAWASLVFIDEPACARCGTPFEVDIGAGTQCGACLAEPPSFARARARVVYNDAAQSLIAAFKHADRTELAPLLAAWVAAAGRGVVTADSVVAPTPLHRRRLFARRYNQAALLAERAAANWGALYEPRALIRRRNTPPQQRLSAEARRRNLRGAFVVRDDARDRIAGRHVVLVDDVLTTGATLSACARALYRAGAARVDGVVAARVVRPQ